MGNWFTKELKDGFTEKLLRAEKREETSADKQDVRVFKTFKGVVKDLGIIEDLLKEGMQQKEVKENLKFVSKTTKKYKCATIKELEELRTYFHKKGMDIRSLILILLFHHLAITRNIKEFIDYTKIASEELSQIEKIDEEHKRIAERHKDLRIIHGKKAIKALSEYKSREIAQEQETAFSEIDNCKPAESETNGGVSNIAYDPSGDDHIYEKIVDLPLWIDAYIKPDTQLVAVIVTTTKEKQREKENSFVNIKKYVRFSPDTELLLVCFSNTILFELICTHPPDTEIICFHQSAIKSLKIGHTFIKKEEKNVYFKLNPKLDKDKHTILEGELKISCKNETSEVLIAEIPLDLSWPVPEERDYGYVTINNNPSAQNISSGNSRVNWTQKHCTSVVASSDKERSSTVPHS